MITLIVLGCAVAMFLVELRAPGRKWPRVTGWWTRALALNAVQVGVVWLAGVAWDGYWLGFVFQRPESHCVHHQDGVHRYNFSDLPVWDMLFGTFRNPRAFDADCGFGPDGEHRLGEMLRGVDVGADR